MKRTVEKGTRTKTGKGEGTGKGTGTETERERVQGIYEKQLICLNEFADTH